MSTLSPDAECLPPSAVPGSQPQFLGVPVWYALCPFWEADFGLRPFQWMSTIQNHRKSLVRS